jgi:hypothetical protein
MDCIECKNLEQAFESRLSKYIEACSAAYYRVSKELAAKKNVDMERAKTDLEEHQLVCVSAAEVRHLNQGPHMSRIYARAAMETASALAATYDGGGHGRLRPVDA